MLVGLVVCSFALNWVGYCLGLVCGCLDRVCAYFVYW